MSKFFIFVTLFSLAFLCSSQIVRAPLSTKSTEELQSSGYLTNFIAKDPKADLRNFGDYKYVATIKVGEMENSFDMILDTGSSTMWIPDVSMKGKHSNYHDCSRSHGCQKFNDKFANITYGIGSVSGFMATDKIVIGQTKLDNFLFLLTNDTIFPSHSNYHGLMGLSLKDGDYGAPPVFRRLKEAGAIDRQIFSMYLGAGRMSNGATTGEIIFGGYDDKYKEGDFKYVKVQPPNLFNNWWTTRLTALGWGSNLNISTAGTRIIVDSGTSLIYLPPSYVLRIIEEGRKLGVACGYDGNGKNKRIVCDCNARDKFPDLMFSFSNLTVNLPATFYVKSFGQNCYLEIDQIEKKNEPAILGDVFLKYYYTIYDVDNLLVGFAKATPLSTARVWILFVIIGVVVVVLGVGLVFLLKGKSEEKKGVTIGGSEGSGCLAWFKKKKFGGSGVRIGGSSTNPKSRLLQEMATP